MITLPTNFDIQTLRWIIPLSLLIIALIQVLYLAILSRVPKEREPYQPTSPIMPPLPEYRPLGVGGVAPSTVQNAPMLPSVPPVPTYNQPTTPQPLASYSSTPAPVQNNPIPSTPPVSRTSGGLGKFVVLAGIDSIAEIPLPSKEFGIGRFYSPEANVLVSMDEKSISRKHAQFSSDDTLREYHIKDTSSSFGTFVLVNGQFEQLTPNVPQRLYNEDVLRFGNVVTLRILIPTETRASVTNL
jgi:pSer/pThr/pTyr-binding forkhead associated (FHA) protein